MHNIQNNRPEDDNRPWEPGYVSNFISSEPIYVVTFQPFRNLLSAQS